MAKRTKANISVVLSRDGSLPMASVSGHGREKVYGVSLVELYAYDLHEGWRMLVTRGDKREANYGEIELFYLAGQYHVRHAEYDVKGHPHSEILDMYFVWKTFMEMPNAKKCFKNFLKKLVFEEVALSLQQTP